MITFVIKYIKNKKLVTEVKECKYDYHSENLINTNTCTSKFDFSIINYHMNEECFLAIREDSKKK